MASANTVLSMTTMPSVPQNDRLREPNAPAGNVLTSTTERDVMRRSNAAGSSSGFGSVRRSSQRWRARLARVFGPEPPDQGRCQWHRTVHNRPRREDGADKQRGRRQRCKAARSTDRGKRLPWSGSCIPAHT